MKEKEILRTLPAVFAVENEYQIIVPVLRECLLWVRVGEMEYYDEANGIMRSLSEFHRVSVPQAALDEAKAYTVCVRPIIERKPYYTESEEPVEFTYEFIPIPEKNVRAYHIADAHNKIAEPVNAAKAFGAIDFLILNGDVIDHSGDPTKFYNVYEICERLTEGKKPIVFSRGNHDMRGVCAEKFLEYTPNSKGNTYYTFRLGTIWGIILDCGEDKADHNVEYAHTVACYGFRRRQTAFLKQVIANAKGEYQQEDVKTKLVISHVPFSHVDVPPFAIEQDVYSEWSRLLREYVKPDVMICGHVHGLHIWEKGGDHDDLGQPCTVVIGSNVGEDYYAGCGYVFMENGIEVVFTDNKGKYEKNTIEI